MSNSQKNTRRIITFAGDDPRSMVVQLVRFRHSDKRAALPSLRQVASDLNHYSLGETTFGGQEWMKTAYYDGQDSLYCGYFTNKDDDFIFITIRNNSLSKGEKRALTKYKKTMTMPERGMTLIAEQFTYLEEVADIQ